MAETVVAFGQNGSYHMESPSAWNSFKLPAELKNLFDGNKIAATYCVVLAAKDAWLCSYKGNDGNNHLSSNGLPASLRAWLYELDEAGNVKRTLSALQVSIGPYNSCFWATDGKTALWSSLPAGLEQALRAHGTGAWPPGEMPRLVTIGAHDNYLMIRKGGGGSWSLGKYPVIQACVEMMRDKIGSLEAITNAYLNPHRLTHSTLQIVTGKLVSDGTPTWPAFLAERMEVFITRVQKDTETKAEQEKQLRELRELRSATEQRQQQQLQELQTQLALLRLKQTLNFNNAMTAATIANMANLTNIWN